MKFTDTHTHLYLPECKGDFPAILERARDAGVTKFFLPAIDSSSTSQMLELEKDNPGTCFAMIGLHPCSVAENFREELRMVREWLDKRYFVAMGEIGLDFYWDKTYQDQQAEALEIQLKWAMERKLPVVIHTRNAMNETIELVRPYADLGLRGIFHCFSGSAADASKITEMNFLLGIGGVLTYKNAGLPEALADIGLQHMVLETDAPYLSPVPFRGKRNESSYLPLIARKLAEIKGTTLEEVALVTTENAEKLFGT